MINFHKQTGFHDQYINPFGLFGDKVMADRWNIKYKDDTNEPALMHLLDRIKNYLPSEVNFTNITTYYEMYLPYDIHTDYVRRYAEAGDPHHVLLIQLNDCDSRSIIFEENATYNDFHIYKEQNDHSSNPTPIDVWNKHLSHCWEHDREYTTLKEVGPTWKAGNLVSFNRSLFHSSDNFPANNVKVKKFIQLWTDV